MRKFTRNAGVCILSIWMAAIIPVTACHHGYSDTHSESVSTSLPHHAGSANLEKTPSGRPDVVTIPCLLCTRVGHPLFIAIEICENLVPENIRVTHPEPPPPPGQPVLHHLRDRSPPVSMIYG